MLDGPTYFYRNSKNHYSDDTWLQKNVVMLLNYSLRITLSGVLKKNCFQNNGCSHYSI